MALGAVRYDFDAVVAVGGDGTINEIANQLVGTKTKLGIIPTGSGNGLAKKLQIPKNHLRAMEV
ncbi:MAG: diacylglycerol/lipid kinase family protein, partial [Chitinophagales bacterium]